MSVQTATAARIDGEDLEALQAAVGVLAAKWSVVVLARLAAGSSRFNELPGQIDGVSRRMLSATLRQLERDGLGARPRSRRARARRAGRAPRLRARARARGLRALARGRGAAGRAGAAGGLGRAAPGRGVRL